MAIGQYTDVYNVDAYEKRVNQIAGSINEVNGSRYYFEAKNHLKRQIKVLKHKESKIFKLLKVENIEQLNRNIENYKKAVVNFSGSGLYQNFIGILEEKNAAEYEAFNNAVTEIIQNDILNNQEIIALGLENAQQAVLNYLNQNKTNKKSRFSATSGMTINNFFPSKFTKQQKKEWERILRDKISQAKNNSKIIMSPNLKKYAQVVVSSDKNVLNVNFTWSGITQSLTEKEAKEKLSDDQVNQINSKMKDYILLKVPQDKKLISEIINHVIQENKYAFFVGSNYNDITGILGEIQGLSYLAKFLGDDFSSAVKWRGGTYSGAGNKKPHQDILLKEFGIQVKNSTKDEISEIYRVGFTSVGLEEMLKRLRLSTEARNLFLNFFGTVNFNVEYHTEKKDGKTSYLPGLNTKSMNAKRFADNRERLLSLQSDIDKLFGVFASVLMYMEANVLAQNIDDINTLYLIGGTAFQTASSILEKILLELEEAERKEKSFSVALASKNERNIIDALNNRTKDSSYSKIAINDIKLTSSFKF